MSYGTYNTHKTELVPMGPPEETLSRNTIKLAVEDFIVCSGRKLQYTGQSVGYLVMQALQPDPQFKLGTTILKSDAFPVIFRSYLMYHVITGIEATQSCQRPETSLD